MEQIPGSVTTSTIDVGSSAHDVLRLLYEHGPSRQSQMAELLHVSVAACNRQFKKLADDRLIAPGGDALSRGGRPSQSWRINSEDNCFLGIVLHDENLSAQLIHFDSRPFWRKSCPVSPDETRQEVLAKLFRLTEAACRQLNAANRRVLQCFFGVSGLFAPDGTILSAPNFPALSGLNPERELSSRFGLRCFSDALHYAFVFSETSGLPPEATALVLDWSDGIGGIVVSNGQLLYWPMLYTRRRRGIWNIGHIRIESEGRRCRCGDRGCLEAAVGGLALREQHPELKCATDHELLHLVLNGDPTATEVLNQAAEKLGDTLYWLIELFGVDTVIFAGTYARALPRFIAAFRAGLARLHTPAELQEIRLATNREPERDLCWGAALMARHFFFYPQEPTALRGIGRLAVCSETKT